MHFLKKLKELIRKALNLTRNMGMRYVVFRAFYEFRKQSGLMRLRYPTRRTKRTWISLDKWRQQAPAYFYKDRSKLPAFPLAEKDLEQLTYEKDKILNGNIPFFGGAFYLNLKDYDWITHPLTGYRFPLKHWTRLSDFDPQAGDIKYVWEKSRFLYLDTILRYDHHTGEDHSSWVFNEIIHWIRHNPLNQGPNYMCSQEIAIRIFHWIEALYFYRHSHNLTEEAFREIMHAIYWQTDHIEKNLNFSLIAVRNNHAITESLLLYAIGLLCPFFPGSQRWYRKGRKALIKEGLYQIYDDGTYLQFSMNYHRVVIQLYTRAFFLAEIHKDPFPQALYDRLRKSLNFLYQCQDQFSGWLPNYGMNDGALFFQLSSCHFRDYRPQLNTLYYFFNRKGLYGKGSWNEDLLWMSGGNTPASYDTVTRRSSSFSTGGFYLIRFPEGFAMIRCGNHHNRPGQADNLHLDLWHKGKNILPDAGSYQYNAMEEDLNYFLGTESHNTVSLGYYDQMEKGGRFIWYYWSQATRAQLQEEEDYWLFEGTINAFKHLKKDIFHTRKIRISKNTFHCQVEDYVMNSPVAGRQLWHLCPDFHTLGYKIQTLDEHGDALDPEQQTGYYSQQYGLKETMPQLLFETPGNYFQTTIRHLE